jgi:hypothetical protein
MGFKDAHASSTKVLKARVLCYKDSFGFNFAPQDFREVVALR